MDLSISETINLQLCAFLTIVSGTIESHMTLFKL